MTRDEVIAMARESDMDAMVGAVRDGKYEPKVNALKSSVPVEWLERFAALVAAKEREACAKVCDERAAVVGEHAEHTRKEVGFTQGWEFARSTSASAARCATAIRARGQEAA